VGTVDDERVLQAFEVIDERLRCGGPSATLLPLRERLVGELLGDGPRVATTLNADFVLTTHTGGPPGTLGGRDMVEGIVRQGDIGVALWCEFDDLVTDIEAVAAHGTLHTFRPDPGSVVAVPMAMFLRYADGLMASEVVFLDMAAAVTTPLPDGGPSLERVRSRLGL
jgi:hypothetical protein